MIEFAVIQEPAYHARDIPTRYRNAIVLRNELRLSDNYDALKAALLDNKHDNWIAHEVVDAKLMKVLPEEAQEELAENASLLADFSWLAKRHPRVVAIAMPFVVGITEHEGGELEVDYTTVEGSDFAIYVPIPHLNVQGVAVTRPTEPQVLWVDGYNNIINVVRHINAIRNGSAVRLCCTVDGARSVSGIQIPQEESATYDWSVFPAFNKLSDDDAQAVEALHPWRDTQYTVL